MGEFLSQETIEITNWMQSQCVQAYLTVASNLRVGISEAAIARAVLSELRANGIADFWYDIPIVVFIGVGRFMQSVLTDYAVKSPSEAVTLQEAVPFFIDAHPRHANGRWGNFAASGIFRPQDGEQVAFLEQMQRIHHEGIQPLTAQQTGADVAGWFMRQFQANRIEHVDVRANFGHSMGSGLKSEYQRLFLDEHNNTPIGGYIYGIEPGGVKRDHMGKVIAFARFEDCVYIPPYSEQAVMLGEHEPLPVVFE